MTCEVEKQLFKHKLREITPNLLAEYTNSAHPWNDQTEKELRHLLPRYMALIAKREAPDQDHYFCQVRGRFATVPLGALVLGGTGRRGLAPATWRWHAHLTTCAAYDIGLALDGAVPPQSWHSNHEVFV